MERRNALKPRSHEVTEGTDRVAHRALLFACGLEREDFDKPLIAVANSWNEIVPGCIHLPAVAKAIREGILEAGGVPLEFNTIAVCDGLAQGHVGMKYSLPSREIIAASIEIMLEAHRFDGAVFISSCDKVTPGMLLATSRVDIPIIMVPAGAMKAGEYEGRKITLSNTREYAGRFLKGEITVEELARLEELACPTPGTCAMMGTANTMACLAEALGMALPLSATTLATSSAKLRDARRAGQRIVAMVKEGLKPAQILTLGAIENALKVSMAIGGSTNSILHLLALARELDLPLDLHRVDQISRNTPYVSCINPSGPHTVEDLHKAGGVPAVLRSIGDLIDLEAMTVSGRNMAELVEEAEWHDREVIHPAEEPIREDGGLAILWGNLAPEGAVVKKSAADPRMWVHSGPARVFDSMEEAIAAVSAQEVTPGSVVVIRYEGPVGGPGMREMHMITSVMVGMGLSETTALVTDGRFSGSTRGPCIGYVSPEAGLGGPVALVEDGDTIHIDIPKGRLEVDVTAAELERRRANWRPPARPNRGILRLYATLATSASNGAAWVGSER